MKNVLIRASIILNILTLAFIGKFHGDLSALLKSHFKTSPATAAVKAEKSDPSKVLLKEAVLAQRTKIESCYDEYLRREPEKKNGSVAVRWMIGAEGKVMSPTIADTQIEDAQLKTCILEQVSEMTFDPEKFAEDTHLAYRFHFRTRAPASVEFE